MNMNKKTVLAIIAAGLITASFLTACNNTQQQAPDRTATNSTIASEPEKAHYTFVEQSQTKPTMLLSEDKQTVYVTSSAEKISFVAENRADREASKKINDTLATIYTRAKQYYQNYESDVSAVLSQENPDLSVFPWETNVDYTCTRNDGRAISVTEVIEYRAGGAVTSSARYSYNFDPITGDEITNVFYKPGDQEAFNQADDLIYRKLLAKYGEEVINYDNVTASFIDEALGCWRFTENGVVVTFNADTIAPASAGVLEVEYTKEELPEAAQKYFN